MVDLNTLKKITKDGLEILKKEKDILEGVVYASANERTIGRIVYMTHLPCSGLEEPKSDSDFGISVEIWFEKNGKRMLGMGHEANELSKDAVKRAIEKARRDAVEDTDFNGFLKQQDFQNEINTPDTVGTSKKPVRDLSHQEESELIVKLGWETIEGAIEPLEAYAKQKNLDLGDIAFILNGDNFIIKERMALATTSGIIDHDETQIVLTFITAMLEKEKSKGSAWGAQILQGVDYSAYDYGRQASLSAINGIGGSRINSGKYNVVFGHQAVTELFGSLYAPHLNLGMLDLGASLFTGKYGKQVASKLLTIYDDSTLPGGAGSKKITCEGYPAGKTLLIDGGKLVGYLSDSRTLNKLLGKNERAMQILGADPFAIRQALSPRNGFRFARGGGRVASATVGIHATNLVIDSPKPDAPEELLKKVDDGIFIGRLWYTYPIGGYSSGIITGTAIAECYTIKNGKLADPILPNTLRLEDNIGQMAKNIIGIGNNQKPTINWASDEITHAPWVAINNVNFFTINDAA